MEKAYFPMKTYNLSQGYGSNSYSHKHVLALDVTGSSSTIESLYAPFTGTIKKIYTGDANEVWIESDAEVLCADGKARRLVMMLAHDNNVSDLSVGKKIKQGTKFYDEGTRGQATGNHAHMEIGIGPFTGSGWFKNKNGAWQINNPLAPEKILWLKSDTAVKNTKYNNVDYMMKKDTGSTTSGTPTPTTTTKKYIVKKGDTLSSIAKKHKTTWQKLYEKNKKIIGNNPNLIKVGQVLTI